RRTHPGLFDFDEFTVTEQNHASRRDDNLCRLALSSTGADSGQAGTLEFLGDTTPRRSFWTDLVRPSRSGQSKNRLFPRRIRKRCTENRHRPGLSGPGLRRPPAAAPAEPSIQALRSSVTSTAGIRATVPSASATLLVTRRQRT